jgi:hypothetical protein
VPSVSAGSFGPSLVNLAASSDLTLSNVAWPSATAVVMAGGAELFLNSVNVNSGSRFNGTSRNNLYLRNARVPSGVTVTPAIDIGRCFAAVPSVPALTIFMSLLVVVNDNSTLGTGSSLNPFSLTVNPDAYVSFDSVTTFGTGGGFRSLTMNAPSGLQLAPGVTGLLQLNAPNTTFNLATTAPVSLSGVSVAVNTSWVMRGVSGPGTNAVLLLANQASVISAVGASIRYPLNDPLSSNITVRSATNGTGGESIRFLGSASFDFTDQVGGGGIVFLATCFNAPNIPILPTNVLMSSEFQQQCPFVDAYHACQSDPCARPGTQECVSFQQSFWCVCKPVRLSVCCSFRGLC